jgi:hypothetical protein
MPRRGVIYAVGPSPKDVNVIWAGTDDGLIHVTRDGGKTWADVTPPALRPWDKVSQLVAGHFATDTAYAAINAIRRDDMRPHVYRTHDGGATWTRVVSGLPEMGPVNVVREDQKQPGLLFAGTERAVYVSADDGGQWLPLRQNMPATSVRDLVIHEDDLVVGTHGRSIWILDNISPLRELAQAAMAKRAHLYGPARATRVRWNMFSDTPLPPEEPAGANPPDGAAIDYVLARAAGEVAIDILDEQGALVRRFSSRDAGDAIDATALPYPTYWFRPPSRMPTAPGHHRIVWDLRWTPPPGAERSYAIAAIYRNTPSGPVGPFVHPGRYRVRLTADGAVSERHIDVRMDPRVPIAAEDVQAHTDLSIAGYRAYLRAQAVRDAIDALLARGGLTDTHRDALQALRGEGLPGDADVMYGSIYAVPAERETVVGLQEKLLHMLVLLQAADAKPTAQAREAVAALDVTLSALERRWAALAKPGV